MEAELLEEAPGGFELLGHLRTKFNAVRYDMQKKRRSTSYRFPRLYIIKKFI